MSPRKIVDLREEAVRHDPVRYRGQTLVEGDEARADAARQAKNVVQRKAGAMIREMRERVTDDTWPLRLRMRRASPEKARDLAEEVEELGGWFADWRNWIYSIPEDERLAEIERLHGVPHEARKGVALVQMGGDRDELRRARREGV